jgi:hypothetical protein
MHVVRHVLLAAALLGLSGCIPVFLHAGYTANEVVAESGLEGMWAEPGEEIDRSTSDTLTFRPDEDRAWRVVLRNAEFDEDSLVFLGHAFRSGAATLVDLEPHPANVVYAFYVPAHVFVRVRFSGDTLFWGVLDEAWTQAAARRPGIGCPVDSVERSGGADEVFTCGTPTVRRLLAAAVTDPKAFPMKPMLRLAGGAGR